MTLEKTLTITTLGLLVFYCFIATIALIGSISAFIYYQFFA